MRTLLERAIVHLLNGDDDKAAALFHKFMVERARQIHESLRQDDDSESLDENWDSEIQEEEYFGDTDLEGEGDEDPAVPGGAEADGAEDFGDGVGGDAPTGDVDGEGDEFGDEAEPDEFGDEAEPDEFGDEAEPGVEGKIDELTDKIDELTAEFDRVMAEFHDDSEDGLEGDDDLDADDGLDGDEFDDTSTDELPGDESGLESDVPDDTEDNGDLAGRMENDMTDDTEDEPVAEGELPEFLKKKKDDDKDEIDEEDDDLTDITESVLAELDKIAAPGNTEHKGVGVSGVKNNITNASAKDSPLPKHNVMDRVKGEPVMTKGPTHKGYARETPPQVAGADTLVKNVRTPNRRKSYKDSMTTVDSKGDGAALLNKDFAPGMPKPTKSIIDGKTSKG